MAVDGFPDSKEEGGGRARSMIRSQRVHLSEVGSKGNLRCWHNCEENDEFVCLMVEDCGIQLRSMFFLEKNFLKRKTLFEYTHVKQNMYFCWGSLKKCIILSFENNTNENDLKSDRICCNRFFASCDWSRQDNKISKAIVPSLDFFVMLYNDAKLFIMEEIYFLHHRQSADSSNFKTAILSASHPHVEFPICFKK